MVGKHPNGNILVTVIEDWMELEDQEWKTLESVKIVGVLEAGRIDMLLERMLVDISDEIIDVSFQLTSIGTILH